MNDFVCKLQLVLHIHANALKYVTKYTWMKTTSSNEE